MYLEMYCLNPTSPLMLIMSYCFRVVVFFKHILFLNLYIHYNMTVHVIKHYTNNRWNNSVSDLESLLGNVVSFQYTLPIYLCAV